MACIVEVHDRKASFLRVGIERVRIEEKPIALATTAMQPTDRHYRASPNDIISRGEGHGALALRPSSGKQPYLIRLSACPLDRAGY